MKLDYIFTIIVSRMLKSYEERWVQLREFTLKSLKVLLASLPSLLARYCPRPAQNFPRQKAAYMMWCHFQGKELLTHLSRTIIIDLLMEESINVSEVELLPTIRILAMQDMVDPDWDIYGPWNELLTELNRKCLQNQAVTLSSDRCINEYTTELKKGRNSLRCKQYRSSDLYQNLGMMGGREYAPQQWDYQAKCSNDRCGNIETRKEPHPYRCDSCHYFHFCSSACYLYSLTNDSHSRFCDSTPPDKAHRTKQQMEAFLGLQHDSENKTHGCSFCGATRDVKLSNCSRCKKRKYCSTVCQKWDWTFGGHKEGCVKKKT